MNETIKIFIIQKIEKLSEKFPQISFKYGFDKIARQHLIEIEPDTEYKNEEYMDAEFDIVDEFIYKFPEDEILFISNNKHIKIEKIIYEKEGAIKVVDDLISVVDLHENNSLISAPFSLKDFFVISTLGNIKVCEPIPVNKNNFVQTGSESIITGDNSYAMAA